jgi:hypothetical protein
LLATHPWTITYTGTAPTSARLDAGENSGQVRVFLNTNTSNPPVPDHIFTNTDGMDIVDCGSLANFTFIDRVPAALKPATDGDGHNGIKVQAGSGATLSVEAADDETLIEIPDSVSNLTTVKTTDTSTNVGYSRAGAGVSNVTIRTNDLDDLDGIDDYYPDGGTLVRVPKLYGTIHITVDTGDATYATVTLGEGDTVHNAKVKTGAGHDVVNVEAFDSDDGADAIVDFGAGTGSGDGLGLSNVLNVHGAGLATIAHVDGGSGLIVVDQVNVSSGGSLTVEEEATIGDLEITDGGGATLGAEGTFIDTFGIAGGGTASVEAETTIGELTLTGIADFSGDSATSTIDTLILIDGTLNVNADAIVTAATLDVPSFSDGIINAVDGSTLTVDTAEMDIYGTVNFNLTTLADVTVETFDAENGTVNVNDGGLLTIVEASTIAILTADDDASVLFEATGSHLSYLNINDGALVTLEESANRDKAIVTEHLSIDGGTLDLVNNALIVGTGGIAPIRTLIFAGWGTGGWTGASGIKGTGTPPEDKTMLLGYAQGDDEAVSVLEGLLKVKHSMKIRARLW